LVYGGHSADRRHDRVQRQSVEIVHRRVMERGIVLIFIPLLTLLSADVMSSVAAYGGVGGAATWHRWHLGMTEAAVVQLRC